MLTFSGLGLAPPASAVGPNPSNPVISPTPAPSAASRFMATAINAALMAQQSQANPSSPPTPAMPLFTCPDGVTIVVNPSLCPAPAASASGAASAPGTATTAPNIPVLCSDGVTQVTDPSQCPSAAAAPGMQITATAPPMSPGAPMPQMYMCPDGVTMTADPTLASCPIVTPTILGINQSTFIWGAVLVAAGIGAFLLLRKSA